MIFQRFEDGQPGSIPRDPLLNVFHKHGFGSVALKEGVNDLYPYPVDETGDTPIGEVTVYVKIGAVTEIAIHRPRFRAAFRAFSFDLLSQVGLVMFPSYGDELYACPEAASGLRDFTAQFEHINLNVQSTDDLP